MSQSIIKDYVAEAQLIIKKYPVHTSKKAVWFIKTHYQNYALKRYLLDKEQWKFMISAYKYLSQEVNNVAPLINTKDNQPWVTHDNHYYMLTNWVKGHMPNYDNKTDLEMLTHGIANLHIASQEYKPYNKEEYKANKLGGWSDEIRRKQGLLLEYKYEVENQTSEKFSKIYLKNFQDFFELYEEVAEVFESSIYKEWVKKIEKNPCLCVNSFSPKNFSLGEEKKVWLLHLDNICIDLPARDLRKLLFKVMYLKGKWCAETLAMIMKNYLQLYPLSENELRVVIAELKAPHLFSNITSRYFLDKNCQWSKEKFTNHLIKAIKLENQKLNILARFWKIL